MAETIIIGGELESTATGNKVADVANIKDKTQGNKSQAQINAETDAAIQAETERATAAENDRYTKAETYNKTQLDQMITTPEIAYIDVDTYAELEALTNHPAGAIYRVANYDGTQAVTNKYAEYSYDGSQYKLMAVRDHGIDEEPTVGSQNLVKSGGVQNELALGAVYDVSAKNPTAGPNNDGKWESLSALLSDANLSTLIPSAVRKGGMSIKFVHTYDNKYIQARCMADEFTTDVTQWQGVDDVPTAGSENLVKSGGVYREFFKIAKNLSFEITDYTNKDYNINTNGNFGTSSSNGHGVIPVETGEIFIIENYAELTDTVRYAFVTSDESSSGAEIPIVDGTEIGTVNHLSSVLVTIPDGGNYLIFNSTGYLSRVYKVNDGIKFKSGEPLGTIEIENGNNLPAINGDKILKGSSVYNGIINKARVLGFIGNGDENVRSGLSYGFIAGHTYRFWMNRTSWNYSGSQNYIFYIYGFYSSTGVLDVNTETTEYRLLRLSKSDIIKDYYDITLPAKINNSDIREWAIQVNGRADANKEIRVFVEDITFSSNEVAEVNEHLAETDLKVAFLEADVQESSVEYDINVVTLSDYNYILRSVYGEPPYFHGTGSSCYVIPKSDFSELDYVKVKRASVDGAGCWVVFCKVALPTDADVDNTTLKSTYYAGTEEESYHYFDENDNDYHVIPIPEQTQYIYIRRGWSANPTGNTPSYFAMLNVYKGHYPFDKVLETAVSPYPPKVYNWKVDEKGEISESSSVLTTSRIYGDFVFELNDGYEINHAIRVDESGNIVQYNFTIVAPYNDGGITYVMDIFGPNKRVYGRGHGPLKLGVVLEITKSNGGEISSTDNIFKSFYYIDGKHRHSSINDSDAYKIACMRRAKIVSMALWDCKNDIPCTKPEMRSYYFKEKDAIVGLPYSRCESFENWFGLDISPKTFITAACNPYSPLYTEVIGRYDSEDTITRKSEYGNNYSAIPNVNGTVYYGLVCSAYVSYIIGLQVPISTSNFTTSSVVEEVIVGDYHTEEFGHPIKTEYVQPMDILVHDGHTYICLDIFTDGVKKLFLIAEETYPNTKVQVYTQDRLQERFDAEDEYYSQITGAKPCGHYRVKSSFIEDASVNRLTINQWDVDDLYSIYEYGLIKPNILVDKNIMFYKGEDAVILEPNPNDIVNQKQWIIVKLEDTYDTIRIEKFNNSISSWELVQEITLDNTNLGTYSDNNTEYHKVDVTSYCAAYGDYRAKLIGSDNASTGYTEWTVVNGVITFNDSNDHVEFASENATPIAAYYSESWSRRNGGEDKEFLAKNTQYSHVKVYFKTQRGVVARIIPNQWYEE